ncbi:uncharacterized protein EV420DRAFT_1574474 [Desarmillaria tabescens]|uniref:Uncharacterized protein n=1 Tax=Armillaria tabescens TaxID=1929756 RepID=A0AA39MS39_ARMTA|nr:uncharacterized protein EV420DRAFT_1574474 [Desarmillaria tabescens]KAK0444557.1 hypothetical protein EV420DRAFT_1574474 [Desarmillaria tabescens]
MAESSSVEYPGVGDTVVEVQDSVIHAFDALEILGAAGFFLIASTALLSHRVQRHPTWFSFCVSWIISCISYILLAIAGQAMEVQPAFGLCVTQAALIYAAPPLTACTTFSLAFYMLTHIKSCFDNLPARDDTLTVRLVLLLGPYLIWSGIFAGILVSGIKQPILVRKALNGTYCDIKSHLPSKVSSLVVVVSTIGVITISVFVVVQLYRNRRRLGSSTEYVAAAVRVVTFGLVGLLALIVSAIYVFTNRQGAEFDIILALVPNFGVVIFGSQADIVRVWMTPLKIGSSHFEFNSSETSTQDLVPHTERPRPRNLV